jgi:methylmalonyl-CoA/ethylmalonyl-CoA epimerase
MPLNLVGDVLSPPETARLHHVGIVVPDEAQVASLLDLLGLQAAHTSYVSEYEADCIFTAGPGACIEFVVPRGGSLTRFNRGVGGLHHIAVEVPDLSAATHELRQRGVQLLEEKAVETDILKINFIPPIYTRGIIVELVEARQPARVSDDRVDK